MKTETLVKQMKPDLYIDDLPEDRLKHYLAKGTVAVDTETRGLNVLRDRLCLVQICDDEGVVSLVQFPQKDSLPRKSESNLKRLLEAPSVTKIFHFARFDVSVLRHYLGASVQPIFCTKIASKLVRTYTDRHSLKDLVKEILRKEMDKSDQTSDWARGDLTDSQLEYAANDVRVLPPIYNWMVENLAREGRRELADKLFLALPAVCEVDVLGFKEIFEH